MSLDLTFIAALWIIPEISPSARSIVRPLKSSVFPRRMKEWAKTRARPLPLPLAVTLPGIEGEGLVTTDPYGDPLTYLTPDQIADLHDENPTNEAALEFLRKHDFQERLIIVLYWE